MCHARKERVLLVGTDQRITSGPAAITAALKGRIHGCTRTLRKTSDSPLALRAPAIHGTKLPIQDVRYGAAIEGKADMHRAAGTRRDRPGADMRVSRHLLSDGA